MIDAFNPHSSVAVQSTTSGIAPPAMPGRHPPRLSTPVVAGVILWPAREARRSVVNVAADGRNTDRPRPDPRTLDQTKRSPVEKCLRG
jgi:hypothetical protein